MSSFQGQGPTLSGKNYETDTWFTVHLLPPSGILLRPTIWETVFSSSWIPWPVMAEVKTWLVKYSLSNPEGMEETQSILLITRIMGVCFCSSTWQKKLRHAKFQYKYKSLCKVNFPTLLLDWILSRSLLSSEVQPSIALTVMIMRSAPIATASDRSTPVKEQDRTSVFKIESRKRQWKIIQKMKMICYEKKRVCYITNFLDNVICVPDASSIEQSDRDATNCDSSFNNISCGSSNIGDDCSVTLHARY